MPNVTPVTSSSPLKALRVLGIWSTPPDQPPLDQQAEALAIYNAGIEYTALRGPAATRTGVVREWERIHPEIVEIGGHGKDGKIYLTDGPTNPGWWSRLVQVYKPLLIVLLTCESNVQDQLNTSDALFSAGVPAIVSVDNEILDTDALQFASTLYQRLAAGDHLSTAVDRAKLTMTDSGAEMIRLRERVPDGDLFRRVIAVTE
jgi:hypothetical protein